MTALQELIEKLKMIESQGVEGCTYGDTKYDSMSASYGYNEAIGHVVTTIKSLLQKESSHTEEIAIGFQNYLWDNDWGQLGYNRNDELIYFNNNHTNTKTDKELFSDYLKTL